MYDWYDNLLDANWPCRVRRDGGVVGWKKLSYSPCPIISPFYSILSPGFRGTLSMAGVSRF